LEPDHFHTIHQKLKGFSSVSLSEMDSAKLLDRTDTKFVFPIHRLEGVLTDLSDHYRVLSIRDKRIFTYHTQYFDTPDLDMYYDHHNGKANRFKIRHRKYVESELGFLEVKHKSNKGRILKERTQSPVPEIQTPDGFITQHSPYSPHNLNPTVINRFNRFTLVDKLVKERVTMDFNITFADRDREFSVTDLVIAEIKQRTTDRHSLSYQVMRQHRIRPAVISKYCLGLTLLRPDSKSNNFKKMLLMIHKLSHVEQTA
jgi:hypothetical protein